MGLHQIYRIAFWCAVVLIAQRAMTLRSFCTRNLHPLKHPKYWPLPTVYFALQWAILSKCHMRCWVYQMLRQQVLNSEISQPLWFACRSH